MRSMHQIAINGNKRRSKTVMYKLSHIHIGLISLFLLLLGCEAQKTVLHKPLNGEIANYRIIEIPNFNGSDKYWVPSDSVSVIPDMVAERLKGNDHFDEIIRSESDDLAPGDRVLLVRGTVTDYDPGSKLREWLSLGLGDWGKSKVYVKVELVDKTTNNVIADAQMEGRVKEPETDASRYTRVVDEIVKFIEDAS
jgi:uncharacterized protein DUF4410